MTTACTPPLRPRQALRLLVSLAVAFSLCGLFLAVTVDASGLPIIAGPWGSNQEGYGHAKPSRIYNGGDPTGLAQHIHWISWGHARAIGMGTAEYVGPHQDVAEGTQQSARIVLFQLGHCHGRRAYDAIEWYFPQHGGHFNPRQYINACTGMYYPSY